MKKFFNVSLVLGLLLNAGWLCGQHILKGVIYSGDNEPVIGATIIDQDNIYKTISNSQGEFQIENITESEILLDISSVGFQDQSIEVILKDVQSPLRIKLSESITNLPEIVVESMTMTGGLSHVHKNIGSAHFIGQKEIQKFSYSDINRTLRNIPGVNIQEEDGYGLRPNIGLRASGSERSSKITVMEDGILSAPAPYAAPSAYYFPTIGRMEALEIMKGSSQIKYGPFTTGGAINLISTPIPIKLASHADFITGSNGYKMIHANLGNSHDNFGYVVETLQYGANGFKNLDNGGNTGFNKEDYMAKFKINTNPGAKLYQSLQFKIGQASETSNETYLGLTESDFEDTPFRRYSGSAEDVMTTKQHQYTFTHYIAAAPFLDIVTNVYKNDFTRNWYKLDKVNGTSISKVLSSPESHNAELTAIKGESDLENGLAVKANNRSYYGKGIQTNIIFHFAHKKMSHKIDVGLRIHEDQIDRFQWVDMYDIVNGTMKLNEGGTPGTESNRIETANATATYLQYKLKWENLTLTPGLRYEHISIERNDFGKEDPDRVGTNLSERSNNVNVVIPGLGINYDLNEAVSVFSGIHKGFAPAGSKEGTKPEESWNYELGIRLNSGAFRFQTLGYFNDYSNLLGSDLAASGGQGTTDLFNGGKAKALGLEIEGSYDLMNNQNLNFNIPLSFAYTFTKATFESSFDSDFDGWGTVENGFSLPYVPQHQFSVSVGIEHNKFLFDISTKYNGEMLAQAGLFNDETSKRTKAYLTADISLNYRLTSQISAFANVNNVTNEIYVASLRPAGLRPGLPRTYNFGLKANL